MSSTLNIVEQTMHLMVKFSDQMPKEYMMDVFGVSHIDAPNLAERCLQLPKSNFPVHSMINLIRGLDSKQKKNLVKYLNTY